MPIGKVERVWFEGGAEVVEWKIENFSRVSNDVNSGCISPVFRFGDNTWFLGFYPNVTRGGHRSEGFIELEPASRHRPPPPPSLRFSLGVRSARGQTEGEVTLNHTRNVGQFYGEDKLISLPELLRRREELLPRDVLTLRVTMQEGGGLPARVNRNKRKEKVEKKVGDVPTVLKKCERTGKTDQRNVSVQREVEDVATAVGTKCKNCEQRGKATGTRDASVQTEVENSAAEDEGQKGGEKTGAQSVGQDVGKMWPDGEHFDVVFKVGDKEFQAHKGILEARTPVLAAAFRHDTLEKTSGVVEIDDCEPAVFEQLLYYVYKGVPSELSAKNACPLYVLADKYLVIQLKALCLRCIRDTLCTDTFCSTVVLSLMHKEDELLETAIDFFSRNMIPVLQSVQWQVFNREHPTWANEIMIRGVKIGQERRPDGDSSRT